MWRDSNFKVEGNILHNNPKKVFESTTFQYFNVDHAHKKSHIVKRFWQQKQSLPVYHLKPQIVVQDQPFKGNL